MLIHPPEGGITGKRLLDMDCSVRLREHRVCPTTAHDRLILKIVEQDGIVKMKGKKYNRSSLQACAAAMVRNDLFLSIFAWVHYLR
jgi:hypothetical protein